MSESGFIKILVVEDNDVSRELMTGILKAKGYDVLQAVDGSTAIKVIEDRDVDLAIVDQMMAPMGGFQFAQYLVANNRNIPVIMVTAHDASDVLLEANKYEIRRVIQKPVDPDRLTESVSRILRQKGMNPGPLAVNSYDTTHTHEELMARTIELADRNAKSGHGGPFGALVADREGHIIAEGASGITARSDPTAHAEVLAIRRATEKLGQPHLEGCVIYCSSEPTKIGAALIASVGIAKLYYGLKHSEMQEFLGPPKPGASVEYIQTGREQALEMMRNWHAQDKKAYD